MNLDNQFKVLTDVLRAMGKHIIAIAPDGSATVRQLRDQLEEMERFVHIERLESAVVEGTHAVSSTVAEAVVKAKSIMSKSTPLTPPTPEA